MTVSQQSTIVDERERRMADNVLVAWKLPSLYKGISAEKCAKEIGDVTTPEQVVDIARDEGAELHKCFEWDDTIAAEKYRVVQAKDVLRSLVIKHVEAPKNEGEEGQVTQFRVFESAPEKNVYKSTALIVQNPDEHAKLIAQARRELEAFKKRYENIVELAKVIAAIEEFI